MIQADQHYQENLITGIRGTQAIARQDLFVLIHSGQIILPT